MIVHQCARLIKSINWLKWVFFERTNSIIGEILRCAFFNRVVFIRATAKQKQHILAKKKMGIAIWVTNCLHDNVLNLPNDQHSKTFLYFALSSTSVSLKSSPPNLNNNPLTGNNSSLSLFTIPKAVLWFRWRKCHCW